jgi:hypothetical protein
MIKIFLLPILLVMSNAFAWDSSSAYNTIAMSYTTNTTITQNIVLNTTQKSAATINFIVDVKNGGGRPTHDLNGNPLGYSSQTDTAVITIYRYNSAGTLLGSTVSSTYVLKNLGSDPGNQFSTAPGDNKHPFTQASVTYTGSLTDTAYIKVEMKGTDGAFWAGNYGAQWRTPTVTIGSSSTNLVYNSEFGVAPNGVKAQGWTPSYGSWAACGVTSGNSTCVTQQSGVTANMWGGGYDASGGTTTSQSGGYNGTLTSNNANQAASGNITPTPAAPAGTQTATYTNTLTFQTWDVQHYNANGWGGTTGGNITTGWTWSCTNCGSTTSGTVQNVNRSSDGTVIIVYLLDANGNMVISEPNGVYTYSGVPSGPTIEGGTITQTNAPAGQTITSGGSSTAGPTLPQTTRYNSWNNGTQAPDNYLYIEQVGGNYNTVNITQSGTKNTTELGVNGASNTINATQTGQNYLNALVQGSTNSVTSLQTNTSGAHYQETKIMSGNNNTINVTQKDNGNSLMFNTITGNSNTITAVQEGAGNHYLENKLTGNGNSVLANQSGATANKANIDLTNAGGAASVDLQQTGGKSFTIIQSCTNPAGCSTVIRQ